MNIGINGRTFNATEADGAVQASRRFADAPLQSPAHETVLFGSHHLQSTFPGHRVQSTLYPTRSQVYGTVWERTVLPVLAVREGIDLLFSPNGNGPPFETPFKNVVCIHDVNAQLGLSSRLHRLYRRATVPRAARVADAIVTVSAFSKREIVRVLDVDPSKVSVIHNGIDDYYFEESAGDPMPLPSEYVLYVGAMNPRKNVSGVVRAFQRAKQAHGFDEQLVLIGPRNTAVFQHLEINPSPDIVTPGYVTQAELKYAYRHASLFVYPSHYEGFGLPPLEAMASGTPVVASAIDCFHETLGDAALLVDPHDVETLAAAMARVLSNERVRERLVERGADRAERYRWDAAQRQLLELFEQVT